MVSGSHIQKSGLLNRETEMLLIVLSAAQDRKHYSSELYCRHLLFHVNSKDGISAPEQLWIFFVWILIGKHNNYLTFPLLQMLHRLVLRLQLQLCKQTQLQSFITRIFIITENNKCDLDDSKHCCPLATILVLFVITCILSLLCIICFCYCEFDCQCTYHLS